MTEGPQQLIQYAIYEKPKDFPDGFIVREWHLEAGGNLRPGQAWAAPTLDDAHALLPETAIQISGRDPQDPVIIEVWM